MLEYSDQDMAHYEGAAPSRVFYGWLVAAAFSLIIFLSTGLDRGGFSLVISLFLSGAFMPL